MTKERKPIILELYELSKIENDLRLFQKMKGKSIISVFLSVVPPENIRIVWNSLFSIEKDGVKKSNIPKEKKLYIINLLNEIDKYIKVNNTFSYFTTLAVFITDKFFYIVEIPGLIERKLVISPLSYQYFLKQIKENIKPSLVVIIDRTQAYIFAFEYGRLKELFGFITSVVPQKIKGHSESWVGLAEKRVFKHIEWHLEEHFKKVRTKVENILKKEDYGDLFLGGHDETISKFEAKFPKAIKAKVKLRFNGEPDILFKEIKNDGMKAVLKHNRQQR